MAQTAPNNFKAKPNIKIKIIGIGGGGGNILTRMYKRKVDGVEFIALNTDMQALHFTKADKKIDIGSNLTRGLGAGMDPDIGKKAAEESISQIEEALSGADLIFITCGLGGGTGSGAAPVVAELARKTDALIIGVVTKPFFFEGTKRMDIANEAWKKLYVNVDSLITIHNDRIFNIIDKDTPILEAFKQIDEILRQGVQGIADLINFPGLINLDFANLQTILNNAGDSIIGIGRASGKDRAIKAAKAAISSPLLNLAIDGSTRILFNISGHNDLTLSEITDAARLITETADPEAKIIFGASYDEELKNGEVKIIVIAGGFDKPKPPQEDLFNTNPLANLISRREEEEEKEKNIFSLPTSHDFKEEPRKNTREYSKEEEIEDKKEKIVTVDLASDNK
jgi:cell division protein FtsZ